MMLLGSVVGWLLWAIFGLAVLGTISSLVYLALVLLAAARFMRRARPAPRAPEFPPVSLLKPLHGAEPRLPANLESFFVQDYPAYEILFATRGPDDPALSVIEALREKYPGVPVQVIYAGPPRHANPKVTSLEAMLKAARHDAVIITDSDVRVAPGFLAAVAPPLLDRRTGLVTCLYRGVPTGSFWSRIEALELSVDVPSGVLVADMLEGMKFGLGVVLATRKDVLAAIGGIGVLGDYYSDDFVLGNLVAQAGYHVELSAHLVDHVLADGNFAGWFRRLLRWSRSTRYSRPKGHVGAGLTYATPYGLLGLLAGSALGHPLAGIALLGCALLRCSVQALVIGGGVLKFRDYVAEAALYPLRDFVGFCAWVGSFTSRDFVWRGDRYRFAAGGKLLRHSADEPVRETVGV